MKSRRSVAGLLALPRHPLPLPTAVTLCQARDGYLTAATQAALLEVYGGSVVAAAAPALAEDVRATHGRRAQPSPAPNRPGDAAAEGMAGAVAAAAGALLLSTTLQVPATSKAARRRRLQALRSPHAWRPRLRPARCAWRRWMMFI